MIANKCELYGTPWTPRFVGGFQLNNISDSKRVFDLIPNDIDILICHGPPFGVLDKTSKDINVGDKYLLKKVMDIKPKVMGVEHVHGAFGMNTILYYPIPRG